MFVKHFHVYSTSRTPPKNAYNFSWSQEYPEDYYKYTPTSGSAMKKHIRHCLPPYAGDSNETYSCGEQGHHDLTYWDTSNVENMSFSFKTTTMGLYC